METKRAYAVSLLLAVMLLVVPLSAYVAGYLLCPLDVKTDPNSTGIVFRKYATEWEVSVFKPCGRLDSLVTGRQVWVYTPARIIQILGSA
jgi:hypothetical protein